MCFYYDDPAPIAEIRIVTCRKPHRCSGCGGVIATGEQAELVSCLYDGHWSHVYTCDTCTRTICAIAIREIEEGCAWHEAWCAPEDLREYLGHQHEPLTLPAVPLSECRGLASDAEARRRACATTSQSATGSGVDWNY